jgi:hypothetical protein
MFQYWIGPSKLDRIAHPEVEIVEAKLVAG